MERSSNKKTGGKNGNGSDRPTVSEPKPAEIAAAKAKCRAKLQSVLEDLKGASDFSENWKRGLAGSRTRQP